MQEGPSAVPAKPKKKRKLWRWIILFIILYPFISLGLLWLIGPPELKICKETVGIENPPLAADGFVDYIKYFNDVNSAGVTPENNFINAWLNIVGFGNADFAIENQYQAIGYHPSEKQDGYMISMSEFEESIGKKFDFGVLDFCENRPWSAKDYPDLAEYIRRNSTGMDMLKKALSRPYCYFPFIKTDEKEGCLDYVLLPRYNGFREMTKLLAYRANNFLGQGKVDEAWSDVIAIRRLGLKLYDLSDKNYSFLITMLVGVGIDELADWDAHVVLADGNLTVAQAKEFREEWERYPSPAVVAFLKKQMLFERALALDGMNCMYRGLPNGKESEFVPSGDGFLCAWLKFYCVQSDPNRVATRINYVYDQLEKNLDNTLRPEDVVALSTKVTDIDEMVEKTLTPKWVDIFQLWLPPNVQRAIASDVAAAFILRNTGAEITRVRILMSQEEVLYNLTDIGLALREYQLTKGAYPQKLSDLVPGYFKELPKDPFNGKDYIYKPVKDGFKLYSVGQNFRDDGGVEPKRFSKNGDIVLEVPLPKKERKSQEMPPY